MQRARTTTTSTGRRARGAHAATRGRAGVGRRLGRPIALLLLVPTLAVQAVATSADAGVVAGFEIDGNVAVDTAGNQDWASTGGRTTDPVKTDDDTNFTGGSKEFQNPSDWKEGDGTATDQGDISDVYSHFLTGPTSWAFLGFRRIAESGTMTFMVEFNQKANLPMETGDSVQFRPDRSVNDLLLRFDQDGNGVFALSKAYKWTQSAGGAFAAGCIAVPEYATPSAWCPTDTSGSGFDGATGEGKLFAEAAVNLSSFDNLGDCRGAYGVMNVRSFAGDATTSSLLDFVGGIGINVPPTCGKLVIEKRDQFERLVPGATFRVTENPVPGVTGTAAAELVVKDGGTPGVDTVADGTVTIDPAKPGTYTVEEIATPAGYAPDTTVHTDVEVGSSGSSVATVEFLNKLWFKPLLVANKAAGSYGVEYDWRVHKTVLGPTKKTIAEGETTTFDYQVELEALPEGAPTGTTVRGTATVTNPNPAATHPTMRATIGITGDLPCELVPSNAAVDVDPGTAGVQVDVAAGTTDYAYTCDPGDAPLVGGDTTATVSWVQGTYPQAGDHPGSVTATTTYAVTVQPKLDEHATVTDAFDGADATPIGAASYTWSDVWKAPNHRVLVDTYSSPALDGVAGTCTDYANVARVDESDTGDVDTSRQKVTVCVELDDLVVTKTATPTFARDWDWTIEKSVAGASTQTVGEGEKASFDYDVVVTPSVAADGEFVVSGQITVKNPNETTIEGVTLTDSLPGGQCTVQGAAGPLSVPSGPHAFDYTCVLPDATASTKVTNTATATWDKTAYLGTSGTASGTAVADFAAAEPVVTDETATVTDSQVVLPGGTAAGVTVKASDGPRTFSYTNYLGGTPGDCTDHDNTAKVVEGDSKKSDSDTETVTVCVELDDLVVTKTADPAFARDFDWTIEKSVTNDSSQTVQQGTKAAFDYDVVVTPSVAQDSEFLVSGVITVDNPNKTTIEGVTLADSLPGGQCTVEGASRPLSVPSGPSTFDYTCVLPDATAETAGTNTATATWDTTAYLGTSGTASGTAAYDFADAEPVVTDDSATVTDTQVLLDGESEDGVVVHAADGAATFTYTVKHAGEPGTCTSYDNTATVVADDSEESDSDSAEVTVCVESPLELAPTGTADLTRDHAWSITKVADATQRTADANGNATFTYTVTARAGARTEAGWRLQGEVAITNPNQWADGDITADVTATTDLGGGAVCTVAGGSDVLVAEDSTTTLPVSCTFGSQPAASGTLSVTATWDPAGEETSTSVTETTEPITFGVRSETNATVQVVDDKTVAGQRVVLDPQLTWQAGLERTYTYSLTLTGGAAGACRSWTNTASVDQPVGTDPTASTAVLVCTPAPPPVVVPPVATPPVVAPPQVLPEVLPEQAFGKAVGRVRASCQGTVRARLVNRTGAKVVYTLRVGTKVHKISVRSQAKKTFTTGGKPRARVTLKVGSTRLDKLRIPALCAAPEVLPDTGLRGTSR